jgi:hypothetical protein
MNTCRLCVYATHQKHEGGYIPGPKLRFNEGTWLKPRYVEKEVYQGRNYDPKWTHYCSCEPKITLRDSTDPEVYPVACRHYKESIDAD